MHAVQHCLEDLYSCATEVFQQVVPASEVQEPLAASVAASELQEALAFAQLRT